MLVAPTLCPCKDRLRRVCELRFLGTRQAHGGGGGGYTIYKRMTIFPVRPSVCRVVGSRWVGVPGLLVPISLSIVSPRLRIVVLCRRVCGCGCGCGGSYGLCCDRRCSCCRGGGGVGSVHLRLHLFVSRCLRVVPAGEQDRKRSGKVVLNCRVKVK